VSKAWRFDVVAEQEEHCAVQIRWLRGQCRFGHRVNLEDDTLGGASRLGVGDDELEALLNAEYMAVEGHFCDIREVTVGHTLEKTLGNGSNTAEERIPSPSTASPEHEQGLAHLLSRGYSTPTQRLTPDRTVNCPSLAWIAGGVS
jgi:hypothetical protein